MPAAGAINTIAGSLKRPSCVPPAPGNFLQLAKPETQRDEEEQNECCPADKAEPLIALVAVPSLHATPADCPASPLLTDAAEGRGRNLPSAGPACCPRWSWNPVAVRPVGSVTAALEG